MKKIKGFESYVKENILFPTGGYLGGSHKKYFSDEEIESGKAFKKGYRPQPRGLTTRAGEIGLEKKRDRKIKLMGDELSNFNDVYSVKILIEKLDEYLKKYNKIPENSYSIFETYIKNLPAGVLEHFDIDLNDTDLVNNFIETKFNKFKRAFEIWNEVDKLRYDYRYEE